MSVYTSMSLGVGSPVGKYPWVARLQQSPATFPNNLQMERDCLCPVLVRGKGAEEIPGDVGVDA